jgi:hypothetical protein
MGRMYTTNDSGSARVPDNKTTGEDCNLFGGRIPIVVGVTGHRALGEKQGLIANTIAGECRALRSRYPHSPFLVLSGLAEGADRLVAEIAVRELGAKLCAVLPLPPESYLDDFAAEASWAVFHKLLGEAVRRVDVYELAGADKWDSPGPGRDRQYARQGAWIAERAQIMFAVWDGLPSRGVGGTADVVQWFGDGNPPKRYSAFQNDISSLDPPEPGLLIHIHSATAEVMSKLTETRERKSNIFEILKHIEQYNDEIFHGNHRIKQDYPLLPPDKTPSGAPRDAMAVYYASNALAVHYSGKARWADTVIYPLGMVAVFFFGMINDWPIAPWAYFLAAGAIASYMLYLRKASMDPRAIEYRGVAEAARVLFFWRLSGIGRPIWLNYLADSPGAVHWVRHAVRTLELCEPSLAKGPAETVAGQELARTFWVKDQIAYYGKAVERCWRHYKRWVRVARIAFALSFVVAFALSIATYFSLRQGGLDALFEWPKMDLPFCSLRLRDVTDQLQMVLGLLAAAGISARAFLARRADLELTKQFASAQALFERALKNLDQEKAEGAEVEWMAEEILESLGKEALSEHSEWLWVRHTRPFEMLT